MTEAVAAAPRITIDTREKFAANGEAIVCGRGIECTVTKLDVGDYEVRAGGRVLTVERKSISDLAGSMDVMGERIIKMMSVEDMAMFLLEGHLKYTAGNRVYIQTGSTGRALGVTRAQVEHFVFSMQMKGVMFWRTATYAESVKYLCGIAAYMSKGVFPVSRMPHGMTWDDTLATLLMVVPGVGEKRSKALIGRSLAEIAAMTKDDLAAVLKNRRAADEVFNAFRRV